MSYCLNPDCQNPQNPLGTNFCQNCGQPITKLRNRFKISRKIGQGGFGKTFLAEDADRRNAQCVVKQFAPAPGMRSHPGVLEKATELFNEEAERLLQLEEHSQIPTLFAYFEENSSLYLVQQFINGQSLNDELKTQGTFSEAKIRDLLTDLLPILQFIHDRNVIHRDIKPDNIMRRQSDGKLILIDFGVARQFTGSILSQAGTTVGTPGYAPIEQFRGTTYPASDLYSLGVTCAGLLTGILPRVDGVNELYNSLEGVWIWREKLPVNTKVSPELGEILDKLLQDLVKDRYKSAQAVIAALNTQPATTNQPPKTNPIVQPISQPLPTTIISTPYRGSTTTSPQSNAVPTNTPKLQSFKFEIVTLKVVEKTGFWSNKATIETHKTRAQAEYFAEDLGSGITLEMVAIPGGTFMMGSPESEKGHSKYESPRHRVTVAPFYMGKYPVTQAQYEAVMGKNPSSFPGKKRPVEKVSWHDANKFCAKISQKTGHQYRLPSEAEWEYACRAGTTTPFHFGETITTEVANYDGNYNYGSALKGTYRQQTTDVGSFPANSFGLYDLHGNVWEWCADTWHDNYNGATTDGSVWEKGGNDNRSLLRGGSWISVPGNCRSAYRSLNIGAERDIVYAYISFRVVCAFGRT
jgi:formylglycine-generating enzyme required for sulfatase activity